MSQVISREDLPRWLDSLMGERSVVAPTSVGDMVLFRQVTSAEAVNLSGSANATLGPKEWLFPNSHVVFSVENHEGETVISPELMEREMIIFGLHPCDAQGYVAYDCPMLQDPQDSVYKDRREKTTLVGMACSAPCPECFCTSTGSGPHDTTNMDVMLTEVPEGFIVKTITQKGEQLIDGAPLKEMDVKAPEPPEVSEVPTEGITAAMRKAFEDQYWSRLADRCVHCNICSYVCPACYCFDVRDYMEEGKTKRIRSWESCQAPGFTKIAGGHDPRAEKGPKLRQRFAHKLLYFPEEFNGMLGCTGCGRCVRFCPVNIDIREIISDVQKIGGN